MPAFFFFFFFFFFVWCPRPAIRRQLASSLLAQMLAAPGTLTSTSTSTPAQRSFWRPTGESRQPAGTHRAGRRIKAQYHHHHHHHHHLPGALWALLPPCAALKRSSRMAGLTIQGIGTAMPSQPDKPSSHGTPTRRGKSVSPSCSTWTRRRWTT